MSGAPYRPSELWLVSAQKSEIARARSSKLAAGSPKMRRPEGAWSLPMTMPVSSGGTVPNFQKLSSVPVSRGWPRGRPPASGDLTRGQSSVSLMRKAAWLLWSCVTFAEVRRYRRWFSQESPGIVHGRSRALTRLQADHSIVRPTTGFDGGTSLTSRRSEGLACGTQPYAQAVIRLLCRGSGRDQT